MFILKKTVMAGHEFLHVSENIHKALIRSNKDIFIHTHDLLSDPSIYGVLALAQHYGLPTPLLDWTQDPWIALYFSCIQVIKKIIDDPSSIDKGEEMSIWIADEPFFNETVQPEIHQLNGRVYTASYPYRVHVINPIRFNNMNLHAQKGKFTVIECVSANTYMRYLNLPAMEEFWHEMVRIAKNQEYGSHRERSIGLKKITVDIRESTKIFRYLQNSGYSADKIFPSFSGSLMALQEMHMCIRAEKFLVSKKSD